MKRGSGNIVLKLQESIPMDIQRAGEVRPPIHLLAAESDMVASLALQMEHRFPVVAAMLLEEIERAELHDARTLPETAVTIGSGSISSMKRLPRYGPSRS